MFIQHFETHRSEQIGWLRAAVLGANDGIVSTASLIMGVAAASASQSDIIIAGIAGLVAGSMSMAAGEYVSVSSQADTEHADLIREQNELATNNVLEQAELAAIYEKRGLTPILAKQVSEQLMQHDALAAHARDELGHSETVKSRPLQAAWTSAASFAIGAFLPLMTVYVIPENILTYVVFIASLLFLAILGGIAARVGRASIIKSILRVTFWGAIAMTITAVVGSLCGTIV